MSAPETRLRKVSSEEAIARIIEARDPKSCGVCGQLALYRVGFVGRCAAHRMVPDAKEEERKRRIATRSAMFEHEEMERDRAIRRLASLSHCRRRQTRGSR